MKTLITIGLKIKDLRASKDLTQEELANMCDMSRTSITNIEAAKQDFMITTLTAIAIALDYDLKDLIPSTKGLASEN